MNILLITDNYIPKIGGIKVVMVNIRDKLTKKGEKVYVFNSTYQKEKDLCYKVLSEKKTLKNLYSQDLKFFFFVFNLFIKIFFSIKKMKFTDKLKLSLFYCFYPKLLVDRIISIRNSVNLIKKFNIQIILSGSAYRPLIYSFILSKWFQIPMITYAHGEDYLKKLPLNVNTIMMQNIEKIIVSNEVMKNLILKIHDINPNKIKIIPYGLNIENLDVKESFLDLRTKLKISLNDFIILTVSRLHPRKGFETILKAIKLIIDENPNIPIKYFIIGNGKEEQIIKNLIDDLNLKEIVKLLGNVEEYKKNQYYKLSNLFVLVPEFKKNSIEGFGLVYIEANYFKLPVIGSRSGGVKIAIEDGKSGFLVNSKDELDLKKKILLLYNQEKFRQTLGEYGHKRVIEHFDWKKNVSILQKVLQKLLKDYNPKIDKN